MDNGVYVKCLCYAVYGLAMYTFDRLVEKAQDLNTSR